MPVPKILTPTEAAYLLSRPGDSLVKTLIITSSICAPLATLFVLLRIWSRRILHSRFRLELNDWICVVALGFFITYEVLIALATRYGLGKHIVFVTDPRHLQILYLFIENFYAIVLTTLKLSLLSLYRNIFGHIVWFSRGSWVVICVVCSLGLWVILGSTLKCIPLKAIWDLTVKNPSCINYGLSALLAYILNILTDLTILSMPIPLVLGLQITKQKKWMLILTFATGGSACVVSMVQLKYITKLGSTRDASWDYAPAAIISSIECMVGFLAVSLAAYRPLYRYLVQGKTSSTEAPGYSASSYNPGTRSRYLKRSFKYKGSHFGLSLNSIHTGNATVDNVAIASETQKTNTEARVSRLEDVTPDDF